MPRTTPEATAGARQPGTRGLSTARTVLRVQALLARHPEGVRADEVAQAIGKSSSTAYNLLTSLAEEGVATHAGGVYRLAPQFRELIRSGTEPPELTPRLTDALEELFARTHKRSYLGLVHAGRMRVVLTRGQQGMPRFPRLAADLGENAHALALGKVALAFGPAEQLQRHLAGGLRAFTPHTVTRPDVLLVQLARVRAQGVALDCGEFDERLWCVAVPLLDASRRLVGGLAVSLSARSAPTEHEHLAETLRDVAERLPALSFQACDETHVVLAGRPQPDVASRLSGSVRSLRGRTGPTVGADRRPAATVAPPQGRHGQ